MQPYVNFFISDRSQGGDETTELGGVTFPDDTMTKAFFAEVKRLEIPTDAEPICGVADLYDADGDMVDTAIISEANARHYAHIPDRT